MLIPCDAPPPLDLRPDGGALLQHQPVAMALAVLLVLPDGAGQAPASGGLHPAPLGHAPRRGRGVPGEAALGPSPAAAVGLISQVHLGLGPHWPHASTL